MSDNPPVLTIDGPSGSGKGTIGWRIAQTLGWAFLDSGAIYRLLGYAAQTSGIELDDESALTALAGKLDVCFEGGRVFLDNQEVSDLIRTEEAGAAASKVASIPAVRQALLERQRNFRQSPGLVADGRDMGTVVFPDAEAKVFLTASAEERAQRRYKQLKEKGIDANLGQILADIQERDRRDSERAVSPLVPAADAHVIDTSSIGIEDVERKVLAIVKR